ncbi:uncharacterized protein GGS22DRAFT_190183 [Annulohypoxylon maeteangense]|uniref:uncharacterized protein n=1 Tax=Annulohypoxylon maeteangense TaxID=1927788 RepID=UPI002008C821|nr:uncharacterized protein GGS22DRAFT_190183 [Annulohypoxylon maeteangense]KAI0883525.1 hypothetical protein GGS22DRAFT_190183 [Annulohypoxylon maeteangense]
MPSIAPYASAMLLLAGGIQAHFTVQHPPAVGPFVDDDEPKKPCGGYHPDIENVTITDFHVDGDAIGTTLTHSQSTWLYRATLDPTAENGWILVYPIFDQSGSGLYCQPHVTVPHDFIGKKGYIGMVSHAKDGYLYQCAGVNFVAGTGPVPEDCRNATGVSATYADDGTLSSDPNNPGTPAPTPSPSSQHEHNGGVSTKGQTFMTLGGLLTVGAMVALGAVLVI